MNDQSNVMAVSQTTLDSSFGTTVSESTLGWAGDWYNPWPYQPIIEHYYPSCIGHWSSEDTISKAFKIVQKLIDKKVVKVAKIKDFIELVNLIAKEL